MKKKQSELKTLQDLRAGDIKRRYNNDKISDMIPEDKLREEAIGWVKVLNDYKPNTNPNLPTSLSDETVAAYNMAIKQWIKHFFNISEEDLDD